MDKNTSEYRKAKADADKKYGKDTNAYKSGYIVKRYKELGGKYDKSKSEGNLRSWFQKEKWIDVKSYLKGKKEPCGSSKISLCRPMHGKYSIDKYDKTKIKNDLSVLETKKKSGKTIQWEKYLKK